jgi:hypothetical protein
MDPYELNITRGLIAGFVAGTFAFAVPWLLLCLLLFTKWLGNDIYPSLDGAWLGSYFLTSIIATAACVSFGTRPRTAAHRDFVAIALVGFFVAILIATLAAIAHGPRLKSEPEPDFGEKVIGIVLLTAPAVGTGIVILAWRLLGVFRHRSPIIGEPTRKQP